VEYDCRATVPPHVQAMIDETKKTVARSRQRISETDANLRTHADWHENIAPTAPRHSASGWAVPGEIHTQSCVWESWLPSFTVRTLEHNSSAVTSQPSGGGGEFNLADGL